MKNPTGKCLRQALFLFLWTVSFSVLHAQSPDPNPSAPSAAGSSSAPPPRPANPAHPSHPNRSGDNENNPLNQKSVFIELNTPPLPSPAAIRPIHHFQVLDARPDSSIIGIHTENRVFPKTRVRQLQLKGNTTGQIPLFLNTAFAKPGAAYNALIVFRKLWISDATYSRKELEQNGPDKASEKDPDIRDNKIFVRMRAEVYITRAEEPVNAPVGPLPDAAGHAAPLYAPVLRYDTTLVMTKVGYNYTGDALSFLLVDLADSLAGIDLDRKWYSGRQIPLAAIDKFNQSPFDYPIFRDSVLVKGVYASFEEFRNNAPSIKEFEIEKDRNNNALLYTKEPGGHSYYTHNAWGICDGKRVYVMLEGFLFPVIREQNAFYLSGFKEEVKTENNGMYIIPMGAAPPVAGGYASVSPYLVVNSRKKAVKRQTRVFAIDADSGIIY